MHQFNVKYLIIGGEAVIYYGNIRVTGDIDVYYKNNAENTNVLYNALLKFWDGNIPGISEQEDLRRLEYMVQFGVPPNRINLLNDIEGVSFDETWQVKVREEIQIKDEKIPVYFIGLQHLIANKEIAGRNKDQEDLKYLYNLKD